MPDQANKNPPTASTARNSASQKAPCFNHLNRRSELNDSIAARCSRPIKPSDEQGDRRGDIDSGTAAEHQQTGQLLVLQRGETPGFRIAKGGIERPPRKYQPGPEQA